MKKLRKFFKELWEAKYSILYLLAYLLIFAWHSFVFEIVANADVGLLPKILLFIGGFVLCVFSCFSLYEFFSDSDDNE